MNRRLLFPTIFPLLVVALGVAAACSDDSHTTADAGATPDTSVITDSEPPDTGPAGDTTPADPAVVQTQYGPVKGTIGSKSRAFLGIPYAGKVSGSGRWKPAPAPAAWTSARDATKYGPSCPQTKSGLTTLPDNYNEDCLTVNVWTPYPVPTQKAAVMVWIHGGAFIQGGSAIALYDGKALAEAHGVVVVSLNYRLGVLGFLAHKALGADAHNLGLRDQQMALKWVQDNITAFGGDAKRVTLFGESAGSVSVCTHLASPLSKGLFWAAAMQSGGCSTTLPTLTAAQTQGESLAKAVSCDTASDVAACLRGKPDKTLREALPIKTGVIFGTGVSWGPIIDGKVLTDQPLKVVQSGTWNKAPVIAGTNKDEGSMFVAAAKMSLATETQYKALVTATFGALAGQVLAQYPVSNYSGKTSALWSASAAALSDLLTDVAFVCPTRETARAVTSGNQEAYLYHFTVTPSVLPTSYLGSIHGAEIAFVFGNLTAAYTPQEKTLSQLMATFWTQFSAFSTPGKAGNVVWPKYDTTNDMHLELSAAPKSVAGLKKTRCDFWKSLAP